MRAGLPGVDLVERGLADLRDRRDTAAALLVSMASSRLAATGCEVRDPFADPEHRLYALLVEDDPDGAHARYNALVRRVVSYARAAECGAR
jgi:hypothetical protein